MADLRTPCAACGNPMDAGALLDRGHLNAFVNSVWARGLPASAGRVDARDLELRIVRADRCRSCGRLDLYADDLVQRGTPPHWKDPPPFE